MSDSELLAIKRILERERNARKAAERVLDTKAIELYNLNEELKELVELDPHNEKIKTLKSLLDQIIEPDEVEKPEHTNLEKLEHTLQLLKSKVEVSVNLEEANKLIKECKMSENRRKHLDFLLSCIWRKKIPMLF